MDTSRLTAKDKILNCIKQNQNFVLQGGAGSGKTETLKEVLEHISVKYPNKKIACITHTNSAADAIKERVGNDYQVSTIHSFLHNFIKDYKKNIHQVIHKIFELPKMERKELAFYDGDEKKQKKKEYYRYTRIYEKYEDRVDKIKHENIAKVIDKSVYDKTPEVYNKALNQKIDDLNKEIYDIIQNNNKGKCTYNQEKTNSFQELTFGHDGLLDIAYLLFEKYEILRKIFNDSFDFIFIDEYQDTHEGIIDVFLNKMSSKQKTIFGLFGDSMQKIYKDKNVGELQKYIDAKQLHKIEKRDNYRCSDEVIKFITKFRNDGLEQEVALKEGETIADRKGRVKLYYAIYNEPEPKPKEEKKRWKVAWQATLANLITKVEQKEKEKHNISYRKLMLTNKAIAGELGFPKLHQIFDDLASGETAEKMEKELEKLQLLELAELYVSYEKKEYNFVISKLKKAGFVITSIADKQKIKDCFEKILKRDCSGKKALEIAFENKLLKKTAVHTKFWRNATEKLNELKENEAYQKFKVSFSEGQTTVTKMRTVNPSLTENVFKKFKKNQKNQNYYEALKSEKLNFSEIINYYKYIKTSKKNKVVNIKYMTMHKTKGSSIDNVLVVLDEYFWSHYNFSSLFDETKRDDKKHEKTLKLFYVSCSRARKNLINVILFSNKKEVLNVKKYYPYSQEIKLDML